MYAAGLLMLVVLVVAAREPKQGHTTVGVGINVHDQVTIGSKLGLQNVVTVPQDAASARDADIFSVSDPGPSSRRKASRQCPGGEPVCEGDAL